MKLGTSAMKIIAGNFFKAMFPSVASVNYSLSSYFSILQWVLSYQLQSHYEPIARFRLVPQPQPLLWDFKNYLAKALRLEGNKRCWRIRSTSWRASIDLHLHAFAFIRKPGEGCWQPQACDFTSVNQRLRVATEGIAAMKSSSTLRFNFKKLKGFHFFQTFKPFVASTLCYARLIVSIKRIA